MAAVRCLLQSSLRGFPIFGARFRSARCKAAGGISPVVSTLQTAEVHAQFIAVPSCQKCYCTQVQADEIDELDHLYRQITLEVKSHEPAVLRSYEHFVVMAAKELNIGIGKRFVPPKVITRYTLLKSVHIFKKHRVQYETRTHYRVIELKHLTGSTADTYLEYIERNLPEGVAMKVTKQRIEAVPDHLRPLDSPSKSAAIQTQ